MSCTAIHHANHFSEVLLKCHKNCRNSSCHKLGQAELINPCPCCINQDDTSTSKCQSIRLLAPGCWHKFTCWMTNSADSDQLASTDLDLHCLQRQGISWFSRTRVKCQELITEQWSLYVCKTLWKSNKTYRSRAKRGIIDTLRHFPWGNVLTSDINVETLPGYAQMLCLFIYRWVTAPL